MKKVIVSILCLIVGCGFLCGSIYFKEGTKELENNQKNFSEIKMNDDSFEVQEEIKEETENNSKISTFDQKNKNNDKPESSNVNNNSSVNKKADERKNETTKKENETNESLSVSKNDKQDTIKNNNTQQNNVSTTFYDSITHGKREFSSESTAFARGTEIQNKELDYVLDYNEQHPDSQIQPDINYFRVYPSAIDENGNYWYYLHFFCQSGEGNDDKLKRLY